MEPYSIEPSLPLLVRKERKRGRRTFLLPARQQDFIISTYILKNLDQTSNAIAELHTYTPVYMILPLSKDCYFDPNFARSKYKTIGYQFTNNTSADSLTDLLPDNHPRQGKPRLNLLASNHVDRDFTLPSRTQSRNRFACLGLAY
jgi:hypothetical protein